MNDNGTEEVKTEVLNKIVPYYFQIASDNNHEFASGAFRFLVKASKDPRVCKQLEADKVINLRLTDMINQDADKGLKERAADFCLNVMKNNDLIQLTQLFAQDL